MIYTPHNPHQVVHPKCCYEQFYHGVIISLCEFKALITFMLRTLGESQQEIIGHLSFYLNETSFSQQHTFLFF